MSILIDPPAWPAHDRLWSHLVSDASLHELRTFARAAGIPDRALDHDHYDVPAERYEGLVAAGARPVDGRDLARRLAASGLRVPGHERRRAKRAVLLARWTRLWSDDGGARGAPTASTAAALAVGEDLVDRWREPHRVYHSRLHLADTLDALELLAGPTGARPSWLAAVALWFHDAVHDGATPDDEERSAALARGLLGATVDERGGEHGLTTPELDEVARLVLLTVDHRPETGDVTGALVSDADLAILGATPARYARYVAQVRAEYGHLNDAAFRTGRAAVLERLVDQHATQGLFRSAGARERWSEQAGTNLRAELSRLRAER
ncbi:DUF4031 domain-containing protein [Isoptericola aurantiacus]|uniref:DUF4031 domain-containing protein n=1 Tax=Isoptericola aurantiacus TaxID=3377839 RepID=UPI00383ABA1E